MDILKIIVVVAVSCVILLGIELLFGFIFGSKPPKDSIEYLKELSKKIAKKR